MNLRESGGDVEELEVMGVSEATAVHFWCLPITLFTDNIFYARSQLAITD